MTSCKTWGQSKDTAPTTWGTDWDYFRTANHIIIILCPSLCWRHEVLIVTAASNSQHVDNEVSALKRVPKPCGKDKGKQIEGDNPTSSEHMSNNVYNTQIPYDKNQTVNLES